MLLRINLPTLLLQSSSMSSFLSSGFPHACIMTRAKNLKTPFFVPWNSFVVSFIHEPSPYRPEGNGQVERVNRILRAMLRTLSEEKSLNGKWISTRLHMHITALVITALDSPPSTFFLVVHHDSQLIFYLLTPTQHLFGNTRNMQCSGEMLWKAPTKFSPIMPTFDVSKTKQPMNQKLIPLSSYQVTMYLFEIFQREEVQENFDLTGKKPFMWLVVD